MKKKLPLILLTAVFLFILLFSAWQLFGIYFEYRQGESAYNELSQYAVTPTPPAVTSTPQDDPAATPVVDDTVWPQVDFDSLKSIHGHVVAWIYLDGTHFNYPVVLGPDNES